MDTRPWRCPPKQEGTLLRFTPHRITDTMPPVTLLCHRQPSAHGFKLSFVHSNSNITVTIGLASKLGPGAPFLALALGGALTRPVPRNTSDGEDAGASALALSPDCRPASVPLPTRGREALPCTTVHQPNKQGNKDKGTKKDSTHTKYALTSNKGIHQGVKDGEGFRNRFENQATSMHNLFHAYCGGTMSQVAIACNDPMFVFHHTFIDKIFDVYIVRRSLTPNSYPPNPIYGHQPTDCILPFLPCRQQRTHGQS
ncbi:unnamed protein product [Ranitomeya imitator]|uniref:Tyrosinase copper-binding domain-containing protein n=1 Tax=Ranitomeya imitator TaxID=111125 RepID=A0ABN9M017_9NEOB|nr:unnamed protein product [Ranitomeya imitator]